MTPSIVALVDDLFFLARILETAKAAGITVLAWDARRDPAWVAEVRPRAVIVDLNSRSFSSLQWIRALKSDPATQSIEIVGFVSHVQEQRIADARAAGCDVVMARSAFTQKLPQLLQNLVVQEEQNS